MSRKGASEREEAGSPAFAVGIVVTVAYGLATAGLLYLRGTTLNELRELPLNSLGDLLAGIFAPLAFLWLVLAVLIQRRELELTRKEFADNRTVTQLQANEAKRQAEFIGEQVRIAAEQRRADSEDRGDALYQQRFNNLIAAVPALSMQLRFRYCTDAVPDTNQLIRADQTGGSLVGIGVFVAQVVQAKRIQSFPGRVEPAHLFEAFCLSVVEIKATLPLGSSISHDHAVASGFDVLARHVENYLAFDEAMPMLSEG